MADGLDWMRQRIAWDKAHPVRYRMGRVWYRLRHPLRDYREFVYWPVRSFIERGRRGWSVRDVWCLDGYIAQVMSESLAHLRAHGHGYPGELTAEQWDAILADMESGFRRWANHWDDPDDEEAYRQVRRSIRLMHRWFGHLWD